MFQVTQAGHRQLALGNATTLPYVTVPSEVILSRYTPHGTHAKCLDIAAGGDLAYFVVQRASPGRTSSIDVLAAGRGQWGGLGNGAFSSAQPEPLRIRAVSGLAECATPSVSRARSDFSR